MLALRLMTLIYTNRRRLGWFLALAAPMLGVLWTAIAWHLIFSWPMMVMLPVTLGVGCLVYQYAIHRPVLAVGGGRLEIFRWPFRSLRIPLAQVKQARIREPWGDDGRMYFLEIALTSHSPETDVLKNTLLKRETVKMARQFGAYEPPPEPYLILQTSMLGVSDAELREIVEKERGVQVMTK